MFVYAGNSPLNAIDRLGLLPEIKYSDGTTVVVKSAIEFRNILRNAKPNSIAAIRFDGGNTEHGNNITQVIEQAPFMPASYITIDAKTGDIILVIPSVNGRTSLNELLKKALVKDANIYYTGCETARGADSLTEKTSAILGPTASVTGNTDLVGGWGGLRIFSGGGKPRTFRDGKVEGGR